MRLVRISPPLIPAQAGIQSRSQPGSPLSRGRADTQHAPAPTKVCIAMLRVERLTKIFENSTDQIAGGIRDASFDARARHVLHHARPVRLRQDHDLALHRRPRNAGRRHDLGRRPRAVRRRGEGERAGRAARRRHGVPVLRDLAAHDGGGERRLPAHGDEAPEIFARRDRGGGRARRWRSSISPASRIARRRGCPAASSSAWRSRARSCTSRGCCCSTSRLSNLDAQLRDEMRERAQAPAEQDRHHHGLCHARPVGGAGAVRPDRGDRPGPYPAVRLAGGHLFPAGQSVRRALCRRHQSAGRTAGRERPTAEATSKSSAIARSNASFRGGSPIRPRSRCRSGRKASGWCRAAAGRCRPATIAFPGKIAGVTFLGATRRVDVTSGGVTLQVTAAADLPLPADGEVDLLFAPERTVALPARCRRKTAQQDSSQASRSQEIKQARRREWPRNTKRS